MLGLVFHTIIHVNLFLAFRISEMGTIAHDIVVNGLRYDITNVGLEM